MFKNKKVSTIIISVLALTLAIGLMAFAPVETASAAEPVGKEGPGGSRGDHGSRGGKRGPGFGGEDTFLADELGITIEELQTAFEEARSNFEGPGSETDMNTLLADVLGITVEELGTAREAARDAAIEQALADGKITEEQVALKEARQALKNYMAKDELLAKALGISVDELETVKEDGKRIPDLLEELGIDQETFQANMQTAHEEALQQAVEDGVITQEQADQMLEKMADRDFQGERGGRGGNDSVPGGREGEKGSRELPNPSQNSEAE